MTRLPKTPAQIAGEERKAQLLRYLTRQSEQRQVMFLRSLTDNKLRYDLQQQLAEKRGRYDAHREPEREAELRESNPERFCR